MEIEEQPILSILVATMPSRLTQYQSLYAEIVRQMLAKDENDCYIMSNEPPIGFHVDDSMQYNIGVKRQKLLEKSTGKYIIFIDDDDEIAPNYISLILEACKSDADCIGISGHMTTNGKNNVPWFISKEYGRWYAKDGIYLRTPNHISPVKRELALLAGFPPIAHGEDYAYSMALLPHLKTEVLITEPLYHYKYVTNK